MQRKRWGLPVALGLITAVLLIAALWPKETPQQTVAVAAHDLGAGTTLAATDLTTTQMEAARAPADAVADPARLVGQTLAVVRFAGEPVTPRHIGPAVSLAPDERGIAVKVQADTGLAGLLRPGMQVGLVATLADADRDVYAKSVLEGLRVVYVSPDFQARPYTPATASATISTSGSGGALGLDNGAPATSSSGNSGTVREGVLVLAASTQAQAVRYETITDTLKSTAPVTATVPLTATAPGGGTQLAARPDSRPAEPPLRWMVPVELIAALNAAGTGSFTLVLLPEAPQAYLTAGLTLSDVRQAQTVEPGQ
jgi:Flp pilus assembly protein CpaB